MTWGNFLGESLRTVTSESFTLHRCYMFHIAICNWANNNKTYFKKEVVHCTEFQTLYLLVNYVCYIIIMLVVNS